MNREKLKSRLKKLIRFLINFASLVWGVIPFILFALYSIKLSEFQKELINSFTIQLFWVFTIYIVLGVILIIFSKYKKFILGTSIVFFVGLGVLFLRINNFYTDVSYIHPENANTIKVLSANIWWKNDDYERIQEFIEKEDPDILLLIEFTNKHYQNLKVFLNKNYPHSNMVFEDWEKPFAGNIVFSKHEILDATSIVIDGYYSGYIKTNFNVDDYMFDIYTVHTSAPLNEDLWQARNRQLDILVKNIDRNTNSIITGDFNLSPWSSTYTGLQSQLLNYTNITRYAGVKQTWESHDYPKIVSSHIDHTFLTQDMMYQEISIRDFPGSDHDAIIFDIVYETTNDSAE